MPAALAEVARSSSPAMWTRELRASPLQQPPATASVGEEADVLWDSGSFWRYLHVLLFPECTDKKVQYSTILYMESDGRIEHMCIPSVSVCPTLCVRVRT